MDNNNSDIIVRKLQELVWSEVYHDTIRGSEWLTQDMAFSPGRGAIGYPVLYVMYRVLNELHPESILEMGMGQSTKMISRYILYRKGKARHYVVEHDGEWIDFFTKHYPLPDETQVVQCEIADSKLKLGEEQYTNVTTYLGFDAKLGDGKYDFIVIDGPYGYRSPDFSRIDILGILPRCLKEDFVMIMDDCDRKGEQNTCQLILTKLRESGIECYAQTYTGEKDMVIIVSKNLRFLCMM